MTPTQTKRRIAVMAKHGEPGWRIEFSPDNRPPHSWKLVEGPNWNAYQSYRAVHVTRTAGKRVPLPWSTIRCGMVVRLESCPIIESMIVRVSEDMFFSGPNPTAMGHGAFIGMEYLFGNDWKPLWTETEEGIMEIISEE